MTELKDTLEPAFQPGVTALNTALNIVSSHLAEFCLLAGKVEHNL